MVNLFNAKRAARGKAPIRFGVGIASGPMIAGYVGTQHRATYTGVGDPVNLAARLETHTKKTGQPILIDEVTCAGLSGQVPVEALGAELPKPNCPGGMVRTHRQRHRSLAAPIVET